MAYWPANHFAENHWADDHWNETAVVISGNHWAANHFASNFWNDDHWRLTETSGTDVLAEVAVLPLATFVASAGLDQETQATTAVLPLTSLQTDARLDIAPAITSATLPLTPFNAGVALGGYQLADIDVDWIPRSTITVSYVNLATTASLGFSTFPATVETSSGINIGVTVGALSLQSFNADAALDIDVQPLPVNLPLQSFNTLAGIGIQVNAGFGGNIGFATSTQTIEATEFSGVDVTTNVVVLPITTYQANPTITDTSKGYILQVQAQELTLNVLAEDFTVTVPAENITRIAS